MKTKEIKETKKKETSKGEAEVALVRIIDFDIPGNKNIYAGLTKIKGVSWSFSSAVCNSLNIERNRKIGSLTKEEISKISDLIKNPKTIPNFALNRRGDISTDENVHLTGSNLELQREFDIKRLKKIRSYRGLRHALGQPVRGQRTRSHFRKNRAVGVAKKAKKGKKG